MRAAASCLILAALACSNPLSAGDHVAAGTWGGEHVALEVTVDGGRIEYDCAHGSLAEPLVLDQSGRFDVTGTHTREHGGRCARTRGPNRARHATPDTWTAEA